MSSDDDAEVVVQSSPGGKPDACGIRLLNLQQHLEKGVLASWLINELHLEREGQGTCSHNL
jgi:hypothetical protein